MSGTNDSVQLNENATDGAIIWVRDYTGVPGESGAVAAQVVNIADDDGGPIGADNPLPVSASGSVNAIQTGEWYATVSGSVSVINPSQTEIVSGSVSVTGVVDVGNFPATQNVAGSVSVLNPFTVDTISGSVSVVNLPATQPVSQSGTWTASVQGQLPVTQATSPWAVSQSGSPWGASVQGSTGRTWDLGDATDSVTIYSSATDASVTAVPYGLQGVSGSVTAIPQGIQIVAGTVTANQGTVPWAASVTGTVVANQGGAWVATDQSLSASVLPAPTSPPVLVDVMSDKFGRQVVLPQGMRDIVGMQTTQVSGTTAASVVSPIANTYTDITSIILSNSSAIGTNATLSDGTNSYDFYCPGGDMRGAIYQVPLAATSIQTNWTVATAASVNVVNVTVTYIKNK